MNKKMLLIILLMFSVIIAQAQHKDGRQRIKALKVAFITERLELSTEEAAKFWPVYNAYEKRYLHLKYGETKKIKNEYKERPLNEIPEDEAQKILDKFEDVEARMYEERKQLVVDLRKVISAKKIILLKKAEDDFYRELLGRLKHDKTKN